MMKTPTILSILAAAAAILPGRCPAEKVLDCPGTIEAEDPGVVHTSGLGNVAGWWAFWSTGRLTVPVEIHEPGLYRVAVRAAGSAATNPATGERFARMVVTVDGGKAGRLQCDVKAPRNAAEVYLTDAIQLQPGRHAVAVAFVNDYGTAAEDRNLFVDWVGVGPVRGPKDLPALSQAEAWLSEPTQPAAADWTFDRSGNLLGWRVANGAAEVTGGALRVEAASDGLVMVSPRVSISADRHGYASLVASADRPVQAEIGWVVEGRMGVHWHRFPLLGDGRLHVYVLDLFDAEPWAGKVIGIVLRPADAKGARLAVKSLVVADRPRGPAELRVRYFGLDDAVNRAGVDACLVCKLENHGGRPARDLKPRLLLPDGVRLVAQPQPAALATVRDDGRIAWTVRSEKPLAAKATLSIAGDDFTPVAAAADLAFTARVDARPALVDGRPYVPEPKPVKSDYLVGAYYFPGWKTGTHAGWAAIEPFPERKPVLGWYEEGDPAVADWHLKWAAEHGVSFFAYDWYWDRGRRQLEHALHDGYFQSQYRKHVKFCLLWANHNPPGSASEADLLAVTRFWIDHYFQRPEYLKVDGRPVVIMFSPGRITQDMGVQKARAAFEKMRRLCHEAGVGGLYLAGCTWPGRDAVKALKDEGYDAATGYNYPSAGAKPEDGLRPSYDSAVEGYQQFWDTIAGFGLLDYIPVTDPGWDSRPWHGDRALVRTCRNPEKFKRMLRYAKAFADAHPVGAQKQKIVLVEAWNEFGEGAAVEPHRRFGFGHLDAIREVFTAAPAEHLDVIPQDVGLSVRQWHPAPPRTAWDFDKPGDAGGWAAMMGLEDFQVRDGAMSARTVNRDPAFACNVRLDAYRYPAVVIRMKLDAGTGAQLFWGSRTMPESEANSLHFATTPDGRYHEYRLDLAAARAWRGRITRLRLDPNSDAGSRVAIDSIRLEPGAP